MQTVFSVHAPKAGGTSVLKLLEKGLGDRLLLDYEDNPANPLSPRVLDPSRYFRRDQRVPEDIACIHGHYHPAKYNVEGSILFTILRHPIDNIISIYYFWTQMPRQGDPLHDYFLDNELSLIEMAKLPLLRRLYSDTYFGDFDMKRFSFIGQHDNRSEALAWLSNYLEIPLDAGYHENATPFNKERSELMEDRRVRNQLKTILSDDIQFYDRFSGWKKD